MSRQSSKIVHVTAPLTLGHSDDYELITKDYMCSNHDCDVHLLHFEVLSNFWDDEHREAS